MYLPNIRQVIPSNLMNLSLPYSGSLPSKSDYLPEFFLNQTAEETLAKAFGDSLLLCEFFVNTSKIEYQ